ncbi:unnamed protein product [Rhizoctonia solani]|uniref:F-box domain-containing protein n=1 Tax=Rhizoctonia solani TaxID=456999 RepID=A0A8H3DKN4_9AGAM|nr:unnamed protein product [Rhizoctonia solani]
MGIASNLQLLEFYDPVEWMSDTTILKPVLRLNQGFKILRLHGLPPVMLRAAIMPITPGAWESKMRIETREPEPLEAHSNWSTVTALTLDNNKGPIHVGDYLPKILATLPNVHSLTLENFELVEPTLSGLTKPHDAVDNFPRISVLRLHHSRVCDHEAFKSVIRSHPLRRLEIRDRALEWGEIGTYEPDANSPLYSWLAEEVPELYVTGH